MIRASSRAQEKGTPVQSRVRAEGLKFKREMHSHNRLTERVHGSDDGIANMSLSI